MRRKTNYVNLLLRIVFVVLFVFYVRHVYRFDQNQNHIPGVNPGSTVVFNYEMNDSATILEVEVTQQHVYIAYANLGVIAVYGRDGSYQHSLAFFSAGKNVLRMRCDGEVLYVCDYAEHELIVQEGSLIQSLPPANRLHDLSWFDQNGQAAYCEDGGIYDTTGVFIMDIPWSD